MNIFTVTKGIIVHQVNCQGVMGCGIALQIRNKYPRAFEQYKKHIHSFKLGAIQLVKISPSLYICNLAGQDRYGRDKRYTNYDALKVGFNKLNKWAKEHGLHVYIPDHMGSRNAGGDWNTVKQIITDQLIDCQYTIC